MNEDQMGQAAFDLGMYAMQTSVNASTSNRDRKWQEGMVAKERQWQEEMYAEQWQNQMDLIDKQNRYNSPVEQKKRLLEAGINPMYMVSGNITNTSSMNASPNMPSGRSFSYKSKEPELIQAIGLSNAYKEGKVLSNQADYIAAQAKKEREIAYGIRLDNEKKSSEQPYWQRMADNAMAMSDSNLSAIQVQLSSKKTELQQAVENLEQSQWYNTYLRSLEPDMRSQVEASTRKLKNSADIEEYRNSMKELNQWFGLGTEVVGAILDIVGLARGRGLPGDRIYNIGEQWNGNAGQTIYK